MKNKDIHNIKKSGFKVPNNYFETLEDSVLNIAKLEEKTKTPRFKTPSNYFDNLETIILNQAKLNTIVEDPGFKTPENYFENLEKTILNKTPLKKETKLIVLNKSTLFYAASIAALIVLFFSLDPFKNGTDSKSIVTIDSLDTELLDNFVLDEVETSNLAALFTDIELNETSFIDYNLTDDTLDHYLEDLDDSELILQ